MAKIANKPTCKSRKNETADAVAEWIQTSATLTEIQQRPCKAAKLSKAPKSVKLLEIPLYPSKKSAAQKMHKKAEAARKKNIIYKIVWKQRAPPKKNPKPLEHSKNCQSSFKNSENRLKTQKSPKLAQKSKKISHCKVFFRKFPHKKANSCTTSRTTTANSRTKSPNSRTRAAENWPKTVFLGKICVLSAFGPYKTDFSVNLSQNAQKRLFLTKLAFFPLCLAKSCFFQWIQVFLSCVVLTEVVFPSFCPWKCFWRKNSRVFWLAWSSNSQLKEVEWFWRLIGEPVAERACMLASARLSPEGQFWSKLSVLFSVWAGKTRSFKELLVVVVWATRTVYEGNGRCGVCWVFSLHANRLVAVVCVNLLSLGAWRLSCALPAFCLCVRLVWRLSGSVLEC